MPFKSVYSPDELKNLIDEEEKRDFIFIDTSGKSYKDTEHLDELKSFLDAVPNAIVYLVESAAVNRHTFEKSLKIYDRFKPNGLILTKLDETEEIGSILPILSRTDLPLVYVSSGQKIPEDLEPADRAKLSKIILPDDII
jgi:flagellar biosynthesis protein FlhF